MQAIELQCFKELIKEFFCLHFEEENLREKYTDKELEDLVKNWKATIGESVPTGKTLKEHLDWSEDKPKLPRPKNLNLYCLYCVKKGSQKIASEKWTDVFKKYKEENKKRVKEEKIRSDEEEKERIEKEEKERIEKEEKERIEKEEKERIEKEEKERIEKEEKERIEKEEKERIKKEEKERIEKEKKERIEKEEKERIEKEEKIQIEKERIEREKNTFTNVWYTPKKYGFLNVWREGNEGSLFIDFTNKQLTFESEKTNLIIKSKDMLKVIHTKMIGDYANNWVKVTYENENIKKEAWFQDRPQKSNSIKRTRGIDNLLRGSENLYKKTYQLFKEK